MVRNEKKKWKSGCLHMYIWECHYITSRIYWPFKKKILDIWGFSETRIPNFPIFSEFPLDILSEIRLGPAGLSEIPLNILSEISPGIYSEKPSDIPSDFTQITDNFPKTSTEISLGIVRKGLNFFPEFRKFPLEISNLIHLENVS